ncbi:MAG: alpha/beta hydrolase [Candidatus Omnitrophica bacterium]|nr:alpha/beta hydrolase [Candidatus Omnitrophota bacterium]
MIEETIEIISDDLRLEGLLVYSDTLKNPRGRILICPPHPFLGGDMRNNVIRYLLPELAGRDFVVMTLNYRGIGRSQTDKNLENFQREFWENSTSPEYESKIFKDCRKAFDALGSVVNDASPMMVIGYSFGCLPALELLTEKKEITKGILVSPPLAKWQLPQSALQIPADKLLIYSPNDFACPKAEIEKLFYRMSSPKEIRCVEGAGHFFIGHEKELAKNITEFLVEAEKITTRESE